MSPRSFRFGLQVMGARSRVAWQDQARRAEDLGFATVVVPDHVEDGVFPPMVALGSMAEVTSTLRVGTLVVNNDFRHPALLAREAAVVDLLSDGRMELGMGAGHAAPEYAALGLRFDPAPTRVSRLEESVRLVRQLFDGATVTTNGAHYTVRDHRLDPPRRPTLLVGGNGARVLRLAAAHADIVGLTGLGRTLPDGQRHAMRWEPEQIDATIATVRAAAGPRIDRLELNALVQHVEITADRESHLVAVADQLGVAPHTLREAPYLLVGTVEEIVEQLHAARERWGFTYFVTRSLEPTAQIIAALDDDPSLPRR